MQLIKLFSRQGQESSFFNHISIFNEENVTRVTFLSIYVFFNHAQIWEGCKTLWITTGQDRLTLEKQGDQ